LPVYLGFQLERLSNDVTHRLADTQWPRHQRRHPPRL